jgi:hypothetical protein
LNVLNLDEIERELKNISARSVHSQAKTWLLSVARNYVINLEGDEMESEYDVYSTKRPKKGIYTDMPEPDEIPPWAKSAVQSKNQIHFFNPAQPRRRAFWQTLENIVDWFNTWPHTDPRLNRIDRISFDQVKVAATAWRKEIDVNPWLHIKDKPQVFREYPDGMKWVKLSTEMHMHREGQLMHHCVANSNYSHAMKRGTSEFYSLRDANNEPHITMEVAVSNAKRSIMQMKGKNNARPITKYQPYLKELIETTGWTVSGDISNADR